VVSSNLCWYDFNAVWWPHRSRARCTLSVLCSCVSDSSMWGVHSLIHGCYLT
jgi:hypothetical protein